MAQIRKGWPLLWAIACVGLVYGFAPPAAVNMNGFGRAELSVFNTAVIVVACAPMLVGFSRLFGAAAWKRALVSGIGFVTFAVFTTVATFLWVPSPVGKRVVPEPLALAPKTKAKRQRSLVPARGRTKRPPTLPRGFPQTWFGPLTRAGAKYRLEYDCALEEEGTTLNFEYREYGLELRIYDGHDTTSRTITALRKTDDGYDFMLPNTDISIAFDWVDEARGIGRFDGALMVAGASRHHATMVQRLSQATCTAREP